MEKIRVDGQRFIDSYGRHRIFNGINYCDKTSAMNKFCGTEVAGLYASEISEITINKFKEWGFNVVRLGVNWSTIEPEQGKYNEVYIDKIVEFADLCEKNGIYFFLDMHQDCFGGSGNDDGAPDWACLTKGKKFKKIRFVWAERYFWSKAVHNCFDSFWANDTVNGVGLQDHFINMWVHVAERIKDHPALLGFDLFNEPYNGTEGGRTFRALVGSVAKTVLTDKRCKKGWMLKQLLTGNATGVLEPFSDPDLYRKVISAGDKFMKEFDEKVYSPFINKVSKGLRKVTDNGIIFIESCYYTNLGIPFTAPAVNYDGERESNLCYTPHGYDLMVDTPAYARASDTRVWEIFSQKKRDAERLNVPVLVGEWGSFCQDENYTKHLDFLLGKFDENKWSQAFYTYYPSFLYTKEICPVLRSIVRPAPVAVCGDIDSYRHDRGNNSFTLKFNQDKEFDVPTVIYAHRAIESIETDGEYKIIPIDNSEGSHVEIKTGIGTHNVNIKFKD